MAKKKKKRGQTPPGVDPNEKRRERLEARRQAKAEAIAAQQRAAQRARLIRYVFYAALFGVAVWFFFLRGEKLPSEIAGNEVQSFSTAGEGVHAGPFNYETSPPVAGPHSGVIPCGSYAEPVANENLVHSLEHGAVYALYVPDTPVRQIRQLESLAAEFDKNLLVAPYEETMPEGVTVAVGSWGHRMDLDEVDIDAIREYVEEFQEKETSEASIGCPNEQDESFEPDDAETPGAGQEAEESPEPTPSS